jgi:peptidoglycan/xylan/chitin deacetylase (PgdA/CDA1 family)
LAILGYHKIGPAPDEWETWFYIPRATFVDHLSYLKDNGWQVLDLATFLRGLDDPGSLPERTALITFDDGYRSILKYGLPELRRFGCPAVMFVPTEYIGGPNRWDVDNEPEEPICTWKDLRQLERAGISIQSHSVTHRGLSELTPEEQEEELVRSKAVLEEGLQKPVEFFSYPYGDGGKNWSFVRSALERAGYRAACLYGGGPQRLPVANPYRLKRVAMGPDTDLAMELKDPSRGRKKSRGTANAEA